MSFVKNRFHISPPIKIALVGFLAILFGAMLFLKPHLPKAIFYNYANVDDYLIFPNRVVKASKPTPWPVQDPQFQKNIHLPKDLNDRLQELRTTALIVVDHGKIAFEKYYDDGAMAKVSNSFSMAKSILAILTFMAIQDGKIPSLDSPVESFLTEWNGRPEGAIRIRDLLTMSSGLNWEESYGNLFSSNAEAYYGASLLRTALRQRLVGVPGEKFKYQTGNSLLLGIIISRAVQMPISQYASEKLWGPLGAEQDALWSLDYEEGLEKSFCCFNATARDFARVGQLMLDKGMVQGKTILNPEWIDLMTKPAQLKTGNIEQFGMHWWIESSPKGPVFYARGILGQYLMVFPQLQRVLVRLGHERGAKVGTSYEEVKALIDWVGSI